MSDRGVRARHEREAHLLDAGEVDEVPDQAPRTDVIPRGRASLDERREPDLGRRARRSGSAPRRVRRTLRHVDPLSVLRISAFYYGCFLVLWLLFVAIVYWFLSALGIFDAIHDFLRSPSIKLLKKREDLGLTLWFFERWALLIGVTLAVVATFINTFLSFLYNLAADIVGGVELTFVEKDA